MTPPAKGDLHPGEVWAFPDEGRVSIASTEGVRRLFPVERLSLPGRHNLLNLLAAVALILVLTLGASILLNIITRHNRTVTVPDFTNMSVENSDLEFIKIYLIRVPKN